MSDRRGVPLWLAIAVTADFGQMEITIEDVVAGVTEMKSDHRREGGLLP
jgi:hypothetical protein